MMRMRLLEVGVGRRVFIEIGGDGKFESEGGAPAEAGYRH